MTYHQSPLACDECSENVTDDDAAPTCGSHRLHQACAAWFRPCRDCIAIWADLEYRPDTTAAIQRIAQRSLAHLGGDPFRNDADDPDPLAVNPTHPERQYNAAYHEAHRKDANR